MSLRLVAATLGYLMVVVGFFLVITVVLPSTVRWEPDWLAVGSFAEYTVEDNDLVSSYTWRITAAHDVGGTKLATINETFEGETHWSHVARWALTEAGEWMPPASRSTNVSATNGVVDGFLLWLTRYYNHVLPGRTLFVGAGYAYRGIWEGHLSIGDDVREVVHICDPLPQGYIYVTCGSYWYDKATGLFLKHTYTWPRLGRVQVTLKATNIFGAATASDTENAAQRISDWLAVGVLCLLPAAAGLTGLVLVRRRGLRLSKRFWWRFSLLHGVVLALLAEWPIPGVLTCFWFFFPLGLLVAAVDFGFWIGLLAAAVRLINRYVFPLIEDMPHHQSSQTSVNMHAYDNI